MSEEDKNKDGSGFSGDEKNGGFLGVPENYFDSFSSRLFKKIEAEDELKQYPMLSSVGKNNPFAIPPAYFELREELVQYPSLRELKTANFTVPGNYFEESAVRIMSAIEVTEEVKELAILSSLEKQNVFAVPERYFEELEIKTEVKEAKIISLFVNARTAYKVAMAAAVALIISLGILLYDKNTGASVQPTGDCNTIACLSKKEILNSNYMQSVSEDNIIEMIDVKALSDSLSLEKNGKTEKVDAEEISEEVDVNTITEEL